MNMNINIKEKKISEIFDLEQASGKSIYTKKYCQMHPGEIPVYAASSVEPLGYVNSADFDGGYLTWSRNGLAGYLTVIQHPFCINADRGILVPYDNIKKQIDLSYIKYVTEPLFRSAIKGRLGDKGKNEYTKLHPSMIRDIKIPMPIKEDGTYDIDWQRKLAGLYEFIDEKKSHIKDEVEEIINYVPNIRMADMEDIPLLDIFIMKNGLSKYTRNYCNEHSGEYKLYSGNTEGGYLLIDTYDYDGSYLTWAKDGLAGYMMLHDNEKFSITGHRSILIPREERNDICLSYIKYILEPVFRRLIKGRLGDNGKNEYTTLNPQMITKANIKIPLPRKVDGTYDMKKQQEIAAKYQRVDELKAKLQDKVDEIMATTIIIE